MTKEEVYQLLAAQYHLTYNEIAEMNSFQQLSMLSSDAPLYFSTEESFRRGIRG